MIKTGESAEQRTARHRKEYRQGLGDLPEEEARPLRTFTFVRVDYTKSIYREADGMKATELSAGLLRVFGLSD